MYKCFLVLGVFMIHFNIMKFIINVVGVTSSLTVKGTICWLVGWRHAFSYEFTDVMSLTNVIRASDWYHIKGHRGLPLGFYGMAR